MIEGQGSSSSICADHSLKRSLALMADVLLELLAPASLSLDVIG